MSNIVPTNIQIPAHLANRVGTESKLGASIAANLSGGVDYPRISLKGSRFRIVDGGAETVLDMTKLDVIIVGANGNLSKTYYSRAWDPDQDKEAPTCYSMAGVRPAPDAAQPQSTLCATCPQNAWGSKITPNGQQIKACSDTKRLAVVAAHDPSGPIYLLSVTPAALKGLNTYHKDLSMRGIPAEIVVTTLQFDTDASFPKLAFSFGGFISEEAQNELENVFGSDRVREITGETADEPEVPEATVVNKPPQDKPSVVAEPEVPGEPKAEAARGFGAPAKAEPKAALEVPEEPKAEPKAEEPKAEAARGFGAPAKAAPKAEEPKAEPKAAETVEAGTSLADQIKALVSGGADD